MTWKGPHPVVELVTTTYQTGVTLSKGGHGPRGSPAQATVALGKVVCRYRLSGLPPPGAWDARILFSSLTSGRSAVAAPTAAQNPSGWWGSMQPGTGADDPQDSQTPLFAKGTQAKRQVLTRLLTEVGQWIVQTRLRVQGPARVAPGRQHALTTLLDHARGSPSGSSHRSVPWITTGVVAKGKILQAGVTQARALVRHKAGKRSSLVCRSF